jgi:selenocysteine-specific elongation factor
VETLEAVLASSPGTPGGSTPRLPVDRVFSVSGFGTVVTGTLSGGEINTGDELRLYPGDRRARVRGLQSHQEKVSRALPGRRTAVNLSGMTTEEVRRGDVLAPPGIMSPCQRVDVRLRLLPDAPVALKQNDEIDFFTGAAELPARLTLLDRERLDPGESAWVQLRFRAPIAVLKHDRFIVRRPSPSETLGGGEIVDPNPPRHRRFQPETIAALETLAAGAPDEILLQILEQRAIEIKELAAGAAGLTSKQVDEALAQLIAEGDVVVLGGSGRAPGATDFAIASSLLESLTRHTSDVLRSFHASQPLRPGLAREDARRRLGITQPRLFDDLIATMAGAGELIDDGATLRLPTFRMTLDPTRRAAADRYLAAIRSQPYTPPGPHEHGLDAETLAALEYLREVIKIADGVYFAPEAWDALVQGTLAFIDSNGSMTLSQFRDHFGTSRKYAQAALEYLDQLKYTRRIGDDRVRGPRRPATA